MKHFKFIAISLSLFLVSCTGSETPSDTRNNPKIEKSGHDLFESKCTACHGSDGTAGIGNAANLQLSRLDSSLVYKTISEGKNGMPSFNGSLTETEIHKIVNYVCTLRK